MCGVSNVVTRSSPQAASPSPPLEQVGRSSRRAAEVATLARDLALRAVPHGFRSSFRDCTAECTETPREVCELALAHVNRDRVEAAYRSTDLLKRRRLLMQ